MEAYEPESLTELWNAVSEKRLLEMLVLTHPSTVGILNAYFQIINTEKVIHNYKMGRLALGCWTSSSKLSVDPKQQGMLCERERG